MSLTAAPPALPELATPLRVLVVDDDAALRRSLARIFAARGFEVATADGGEAALEHIGSHEPDVALVDLKMPGMDGLELLRRMKATRPEIAVIMMTAFADVDAAFTAVKGGAYHFLTKPFESNDAVALTIRKAAEHRRLANRTKKLEERLEAQERFGELIGTSAAMQEVYRIVSGVASTTSTVLVLGESGTGKELVARAIHQRSPRADKPIVTVNCAAIPKELVESELFGHVRGAFTGANAARAGLFESAHGSTIFLDEVGDLPLPAQVKLLRTLQEGEIKRVGSDETRIVDVRVVAATNVDLPGKLESGAFRRDLFYRLNVIAIRLPALRERGDDTLLLTHHFMQKLARRMGREPKTISVDALHALRSHPWPGNVRELEHAIEHAVVLSQGNVIEASDLPFARPTHEASSTLHSAADAADPVAAGVPGPSQGLPLGELVGLPYAEAKRRMLALFDERYVAEALKRAGGNIADAARGAGLDRSNFRRVARKKGT